MKPPSEDGGQMGPLCTALRASHARPGRGSGLSKAQGQFPKRPQSAALTSHWGGGGGLSIHLTKEGSCSATA